jgi:general secretion pathway protein G
MRATSKNFHLGAGFTLIELLVASAILALLASIALPVAEYTAKRENEIELRESLRTIRNALDAYKEAVDTGKIARESGRSGFPSTLSELVTGVENQTDPQRGKLYFLRRIPRDPFAPKELEAIDTWGKRSYESSADNPREGVDIFDVYSKSSDEGTNGVPYANW